jgi:hypothetical protein
MSRRNTLPLSPLRSSLPSERPPYVAVSPLRHSVVEPVESLLHTRLARRYDFLYNQLAKYRLVSQTLLEASATQKAMPASHRRCAGLGRRSMRTRLRCDRQTLPALSPIKPALPLIILSDLGRAPIQSFKCCSIRSLRISSCRITAQSEGRPA